MLVSPLGSAQSPSRNLQLHLLLPCSPGTRVALLPGSLGRAGGALPAGVSPVRVPHPWEGADAVPRAPEWHRPRVRGHWDNAMVWGGNSIHARWDLGSWKSCLRDDL